MKDLKFIIGNNINHLRTKKGITQQQLGEQLNYSDKTISKWERGESLPDIVVLKNLADFFQVSLDYLVEETHKIKGIKQENLQKENRRNSYIITISNSFICDIKNGNSGNKLSLALLCLCYTGGNYCVAGI